MKKLLGLLITPLLYIRYSFLLFSPIMIYLMLTTGDYSGVIQMWFIVWFVYGLFFGMLMANLGVMEYWSKLFVKILGVKYKVVDHWSSDMLHSHSVWSHPVLEVNGKQYKLMIATMGGNLYDEDDNIRRKAIIYHLFN